MKELLARALEYTEKNYVILLAVVPVIATLLLYRVVEFIIWDISSGYFRTFRVIFYLWIGWGFFYTTNYFFKKNL